MVLGPCSPFSTDRSRTLARGRRAAPRCDARNLVADRLRAAGPDRVAGPLAEPSVLPVEARPPDVLCMACAACAGSACVRAATPLRSTLTRFERKITFGPSLTAPTETGTQSSGRPGGSASRRSAVISSVPVEQSKVSISPSRAAIAPPLWLRCRWSRPRPPSRDPRTVRVRSRSSPALPISLWVDSGSSGKPLMTLRKSSPDPPMSVSTAVRSSFSIRGVPSGWFGPGP